MPVSCPYCSKEFSHQGALNLHLKKAKSCKDKANNVKADTCEHEFRMLTEKELMLVCPDGKSIASYGFAKVCKRCETLA